MIRFVLFALIAFCNVGVVRSFAVTAAGLKGAAAFNVFFFQTLGTDLTVLGLSCAAFDIRVLLMSKTVNVHIEA